ncbi:MAG: alpha/beta hydrolase [Myxococcota bacterium]
MIVGWIASAAWGADPAGEREKLERRTERWSERTERAQERLEAAEDPKEAARAERGLVDTRFRLVDLARRLDAWEAPAATVEVLFATNRDPSARGFGARDADRLSYGVATVYVPERHPRGLMERELEVRAIRPLTEEGFQIALHGALLAAGPEAEVLTYVHGYNNSFDYAARRTAQIANDLEPSVVPVLFTWPSRGGEWFAGAKYTYDENAAARSSTAFAEVLEQLVDGSGAPVNVLAHSMGARVVSDALVDLDRRGAVGRGFDDLVFAAPDIDAVTFGRRYQELSLATAGRVTIYCASDDRALAVSRSVHGGYDRLGTCRPETIAALEQPRFDFVDASKLYVDVLDHDKVADSPRLLDDLGAVVRGVPPEQRALVSKGDHFELPP